MCSALTRGFKVHERLDRNSPLMTLAAMCIYLQRQKRDRDGQESKQNEATEQIAAPLLSIKYLTSQDEEG